MRTIGFICVMVVCTCFLGACRNDSHSFPPKSQIQIGPCNEKSTASITEIEAPTTLLYGSGSNPLSLNFYRPSETSKEKAPLIVALHGGAFLFGSKENAVITRLCRDMAAAGYAVASVDYRPISWDIKQEGLEMLRGLVSEVTYAERQIYRSIQDVRAAVRYLKANAEKLGLDSSRVYALGYSAGGVLALNLACLDEEEAQDYFELRERDCLDCEAFNGQVGTGPSARVQAVISIAGGVFDTAYVDADEPTPMLLIHGDADQMVPYKVGQPFQNLLEGDRISLPGVAFELGITDQQQQSRNLSVDGLGFSLELDIPAELPDVLVELLAPRLYGSSLIYERVEADIRFLQVKDGDHGFFRNESGQFYRCYDEMCREMCTFLARYGGIPQTNHSS